MNLITKESLSNIPLRVIFLIHLILISCTLQDRYIWISFSYCFYNLIFILMILGIVCLPPQHSELISLTQNLNLLSIIFDILLISIHYYDTYQGFPRISAIFNLIFRIITTLVLNKMYIDRTGNSSYPNISKIIGANLRKNDPETPEISNSFSGIVITPTEEVKPPPYDA